MSSELTYWKRLRTRFSGTCVECGRCFGKGSVIEWHCVNRKVRCGYCARGVDPRQCDLSTEELERVRQCIDELSRLANLPSPRSTERDVDVQRCVRFLDEYRFLRVVQAALLRGEGTAS